MGFAVICRGRTMLFMLMNVSSRVTISGPGLKVGIGAKHSSEWNKTPSCWEVSFLSVFNHQAQQQSWVAAFSQHNETWQQYIFRMLF